MTSAMPTLEGDSRLYGVAVKRVEYPAGIGGVRLSLSEIARRIYEGSRAPSMRAFAEGVIRNWARVPANVQITNKQAAQTFLDYVRAAVRYRPDPPLTEYTQSAPISLCVPGAPMCVPVGDCDDLVTALATLAAAYGIPVHVVKQTFGGDQQEHVLVEMQDDAGQWLAADPSVPDKPLGWKAPAAHEDVIDPSDPSSIGLVGAPEAEFIGVGRVGAWHGRLRQPRSIVQLVGHGLGRVGVAQALAAPSYQLLTDRNIYSSNRYRIGMLVNFLGSYAGLSTENQRTVLVNNLPGWDIEQLSPTGDVTGGIQSWILQGVAKTDMTLTDTPLITYSVIAGQVTSGIPPTAPLMTGSGNISAAKVAFAALAIGAAATVGSRLLRRRRR